MRAIESREFIKKVKKLFSGFLKLLFSGIGMSVLASCAMLEDSFNEPVKSFFELYTDTAAIEKYEVKGYEGVFSNGTYYVGCGDDFSVSFYLRNPKEYAFTDKVNIRMSHPEFKIAAAQAEWPHLWGAPLDPMANYTLTQNPKDMSEIILTVKKDFLRACEGGFNISPNFDLIHPLSGVPFESYSDLKVVCNSLPVEPYGGVVMIYDTNKYVVCFNMGSVGNFNSKGIHKDIKSIKITSSKGQSETFDFDIAADGNLSILNGGTRVVKTAPASIDVNNEASGLAFSADANSFYYLTGTTQSTENIIYSLTVTDKGGLSSTAETSVKAEMLGPALITSARDGSNVPVPTQALTDPFDADTNVRIDQNASTGMGSIRIAPPTMTKNPNNENHPVSGVTVYYELYASADGINYEPTPYDSGKLTSAKTIPVVPTYTKVKVSSRKRTYIDSETVVGYVKPLVKTVYVSAGASSGLGTKTSPVNSIATAVGYLENDPAETENRIILLSDITEDFSINYANKPATIVGSNSSGVATVRKISRATSGTNFIVSAGAYAFTDITFGAGIDYTSSENLKLKNCTVNGDVNLNGTGMFILSGTSSVTHTEANPYTISLNGKYVYTDNTLTKTPAAWLIPASYSQYSDLSYAMVKPVTGVTLTSRVADNFSVMPNGGSNYYCVLGPANSGVLTKNLAANVELGNMPDKVKLVLSKVDNVLICTVEDENGNPLTASNIFMGIMDRNDIKPDYQVSRSNSSSCRLNGVPVAPPGNPHKVFMSCTYNGMTYTAIKDCPTDSHIYITSTASYKVIVDCINNMDFGYWPSECSFNIDLLADITIDNDVPELLLYVGYTGTFDGHGHTITMNIEDSGERAALFYNVETNGVVKNLVLKGKIKSRPAGGLSSYNMSAVSRYNSGTIYNVVSYVNVEGDDINYIGGITSNCSGGKIYNCVNYGNILNERSSSGTGAGGICGMVRESGEIRNCFSFGTVRSSNSGGIVGKCDSATVSGCYYRELSEKSSSGNIVNHGGYGVNNSGSVVINSISASSSASTVSSLNNFTNIPSGIRSELWTWSVITDADSPYNGWPTLNVVQTNP